MRPALVAALLLVSLPAPLAAKAAVAWPTGLYSDVRTVAETGDILGLETRFYQEGERHMVEFALCEGWCNEVRVAEVRRGDNGFAFGFGQVAEGGAAIDMHVVVWPAGRGLKYTVYQGREPLAEKPGLMRRTTRLFGIGVAKSGRE